MPRERDPNLPSALADDDSDSLRHKITEEGRAWERFADTQLVGLIGSDGRDRVRDAASAEIQRRNAVAIRDFSINATAQTERLIALAEETSRQTDKLIVLTKWITWLTV